LIVQIILFAAFGCEAEKNSKDYREPYLGSFAFSSYSFYTINDITTYYDTVIFEGLIELDTENDSSIIITYRPEESGGYTCNDVKVYGSQIKPKLLALGTIDYPLIRSMCGPHGYFFGSFIGTDSISFALGAGSIGLSNGQTVTGARNK